MLIINILLTICFILKQIYQRARNEYDAFIKIKKDDFKDNTAVVSCYLKILYVHTNIFEIKDQEVEEDEIVFLRQIWF